MGDLFLHGVIGLFIAAVIAQLAGAFGTMGIVRANQENPERGVIVGESGCVAWLRGTEVCREVVWWQRGLAAGERQEMRRGPSMMGDSGWYLHGSRLQGLLMYPQGPAPWWSRANDPREVELLRQQDIGRWDDMRNDYAVGWPWRSFRYEEDRLPTFNGFESTGVPRHAIQLPARQFSAGPFPVVFDKNFLSWNPIWPGLIGSTAFWGLASFAVTFAAGRARHHRRLAKGLCPKCRYDLRGLPSGAACPECGVSRC